MKESCKKMLKMLMSFSLAALIFAGCSSESEPVPEVEATAITLNYSDITLMANTGETFIATAEPSNAAVHWSVSGGKASLSSGTGSSVVVKPAAEGEITVYAKSASGSVSASCTVNVLSGGSGGTNFFWKAQDYSSPAEISGDIVYVNGSKCTVSDTAGAVTAGTETFTKYFGTGGGGSISSAALKFSLYGKATVKIYAASGNTGDERTLRLANSSKILQEYKLTTAQEYTFSYTGSGEDLYLYSAGSGISIYGIKVEYAVTSDLKVPAGVTLSETMLEKSVSDPSFILNASVTGEYTAGYDVLHWYSSDPAVAEVTAGAGTKSASVRILKSGFAKIYVKTVNGKSADCDLGIGASTSVDKKLKLTDRPVGFGSASQRSGSGTTVSTKSQLVSALARGGLIYVNGMIDISEGMLPSEGGGSTDALDKFVKDNSSFSSYSDFKTKYAGGCTDSTDDKKSSAPSSTYGAQMWTLNKAYGVEICLYPVSNTTIIGLDENSGIKGGSIQISGVNNVVIRNLTLQDAYDPFPHHEKNDGFNAQWDLICISGGSSNIWIDHCTLEDTLHISQAALKNGLNEKWQTYDGLCDIKGSGAGITVSYCILNNHDKTMLIGSDDSEGDSSVRKITLHHNYFHNCGQRLPMVRNTRIHIYNNYYNSDSDKYYVQSYCIGVRQGSLVMAEANHFGTGINYSLKDSYGKAYAIMNKDESSGGCATALSEAKTFVPPYEYEIILPSEVESFVLENAGAGKWPVEK